MSFFREFYTPSRVGDAPDYPVDLPAEALDLARLKLAWQSLKESLSTSNYADRIPFIDEASAQLAPIVDRRTHTIAHFLVASLNGGKSSRLTDIATMTSFLRDIAVSGHDAEPTLPNYIGNYNVALGKVLGTIADEIALYPAYVSEAKAPQPGGGHHYFIPGLLFPTGAFPEAAEPATGIKLDLSKEAGFFGSGPAILTPIKTELAVKKALVEDDKKNLAKDGTKTDDTKTAKSGGVVKCAICDFTESTKVGTTVAAALVGGLLGGIVAAFVAKPGNLPVMGASVLGGALVVGGTVNYLTMKKIETCRADCA